MTSEDSSGRKRVTLEQFTRLDSWATRNGNAREAAQSDDNQAHPFVVVHNPSFDPELMPVLHLPKSGHQPQADAAVQSAQDVSTVHPSATRGASVPTFITNNIKPTTEFNAEKKLGFDDNADR